MSLVFFRLSRASVRCYLQLTLAASICLISCDAQNRPMDASTRSRIDSIANAQIAIAQIQQDSLCKAAQISTLPHLVDSIKQVRLREIEAQLNTIPK